jgi:hypothetical protein
MRGKATHTFEKSRLFTLGQTRAIAIPAMLLTSYAIKVERMSG